MWRKTVVAVSVAGGFALAGCGVPGGSPGARSGVSTTSAPALATSVPVPTTSAAAKAALVTVPDVSGMNHQQAQDTMQAAGLYNLREVDGKGLGRMLLVDRNLVQTSQDPAAGKKVT